MNKVNRQAIQDYVDAVVREFHPMRIILFGSHAYGRPTPDSDVDLMVVMPFRGSSLMQAFRIRNRLGYSGFPMDLVVRRPAQVRAVRFGADPCLHEAVNRGKVLYEA